jgi:hypothetical protein
MEDIITILPINPNNFELQEYSTSDTSLIQTNIISVDFDPQTDNIEYFVYNLNNEIIASQEANFGGYSIINNNVSIDPVSDLKNNGQDEGSFNTLYNFQTDKIGSYFYQLFIQEISSDRTEIRLSSNKLLDIELITQAEDLINEINNAPVDYVDFLLNFGKNQLIIANNILLDTSNTDTPSILIKLYDPLPNNFNTQSECWVVEQLAESIAYNISISPNFSEIDNNIYLKGPNLNIPIKDRINNSTPYGNYNSLSSTNSIQGSGSLQYQLNSLLVEKGIEINIDYSDYSNFINFSSAQTRVENFYYKLSLIETYNESASYSSGITTNTYISSSNNVWQTKINELITGFDSYEYFLYFESGSANWPKSNSTYPYVNETSTSVIGQNWLVNQSTIAESFDLENNNSLVNSIPLYIREDAANSQFELFIEMIGQHFDSIFVYLQDVTNKYNADNRLDYGVSKDLVADIIRDLGVKIYQNNFSSNDLYQALLGITPSGSLYNLPYTTGILPTPSGWEYIDTYTTASATGSLEPTDDVNKSIYKRIYHNLPYLLKKKGTVEGLRALISIYGIPDTILRVNEFGGKDKDNSNDWDFWYNQFDYQYNTNNDGIIQSNWEINSLWNSEDDRPQTVEFRFQTPGLESALSKNTQSLWSLDSDVRIDLEYTGSGYTSGSYSGSIPNPENEYATLKFITNNESASIYLPFYDGGWWSVAVTRDGDNFNLFAGNNIYTGEEGSSIGFTGSATLNSSATEWINGTYSDLSPLSINNKFSGSFQELRFYNTPILRSVFDDYVMNHNSIEGNQINSSPEQLAFRASLGGELYVGNESIHPKSTGSIEYITSSFTSGNVFDITNGEFTSKEEYVYFDQVPAGIKNRNSNKIKQSTLVLPYTSSTLNNLPNNNILSPLIRVQQNSYVSESYTQDLDYVEVAFSPQNEINDDIINSIGYFNIGDYIGDPRQVSSSADFYPELNTLRDEYFKKYKSNYDIWDYVRLIKYLDNSLFKMLKDWVPARTSLAAGVVIKQHLLERNKYPVPQVDTYTTTSFQMQNQPFVFQNIEITGSPIQMYTITGSNGGSMPDLEGEVSGSGPGFNISPITQSWTGSTPSLLGSVGFTETYQYEFYNGELSGSEFIATNGELNTECDPFKSVDTTVITYNLSGSFSSSFSEFNAETNAQTDNGEIHIWFDRTLVSNSPNDVAGGTFYYRITALSIAKESLNSLDLNNYIPQALEIILNANYITANFTLTGWSNSFPYTGTTIAPSWVGNPNPTLVIDNIQERTSLSGDGYYLLQCVPNQDSYFKIYTDYTGIGTVSVTPKSSVLTIIEPFVPASFQISDCNVILNNAPVARFNTLYMDVDYSSNAIVAVNQQSIINGNATKAEVQASNYTTARVIYPRYIGSKNTSPDFNVGYNSSNINEQSIFNNSETSLSPPSLPSVESDGVYFAYFDWVGGTTPELINKSAAHIMYLIDTKGNAYTPNLTSSYYYNLIDSFNSNNNKANVLLIGSNIETTGSNNSQIPGTVGIIKPSAQPKAIIFSQTGSLSNILPSMSFSNPNVLHDYTISCPLDASPPNFPKDVIDWLPFGTPTFPSGSDVRAYPLLDQIEILESDNNINISLNLSLDFQVPPIIYSKIFLDFQTSTDGGSTWTSIYQDQTPLVQGTNTFRSSTPFRPAIAGDLYAVRFSCTYGGADSNPLYINPSSFLSVTQNPLPGDDVYYTSGSIDYWTIGGGTGNVLTGSQFTSLIYGSNQNQVTSSTGQPSYDYPYINFNIQPMDEIRFSANEELSYQILEVTPPSDTTTDELYIKIDRTISTGSIDINSFMIRRYVPNPNFVVLDSSKPSGLQIGAGFLLPEYSSNELNTKFDEIIQNLTEKGLI